MKITVFSNLYPPVFIGGYEIGASQIVSELRKRGHEILLLSAHEYHLMHPGGTHEHAGHAAGERAAIVDVGPCVFGSVSMYVRRRRLRFLVDLARAVRARRRYRAAVRAFRPDCFLVFNPLGVIAPVLDDFVAYSRETGAPFNAYVSDHWVAAWPSGNPLWPALARFWQSPRKSVRLAARVAGKLLRYAGLVPQPLPLVDRYFYCSAFIRKISRDNSSAIAGHEVVHWGLTEVGRLSAPPADHFLDPRPLTLLYAGQLLEHKGLPVLIRALARCRARHPLVVIGDDQGEYAAVCKKLAAKLGVLGQIQFLGKKSHAETLELLGRSGHVLVVPSLWDEPFSIVVLEGMGVGLPVIASDTGGTAEAIEDGENGFLFPRGNFRELAAVVDRLEGDRTLCRRVGARARKCVQARFTMEQMVDQILSHLTGSPPGSLKNAA
jgi:glycosyltransferase involved in cell wall biosynthesis